MYRFTVTKRMTASTESPMLWARRGNTSQKREAAKFIAHATGQSAAHWHRLLVTRGETRIVDGPITVYVWYDDKPDSYYA
jgi:hypothetical protein